MNIGILFPFLAYLLLFVVIIFYTRRPAGVGKSGFYLGEGKMNPALMAVSSVVSSKGSWLLLGITAQSYILGISAIWLVAGYIISEFFLLLFLAPAFRKHSGKKNFLSITEIITSRLPVKEDSTRLIISIILSLFLIVFISSQLYGLSKAFLAFYDIPMINGMIISGVIILFSVFFGGFKTLSYTDILNSAIMLIALVGIPLLILFRADGFSNLHNEIAFKNPQLFSFKTITAGASLSLLTFGLGSGGNVQSLTKYLAVRPDANFKKVAIFGTLVNVVLSFGAISLGIFARLYIPEANFMPGADAQNTFIGVSEFLLSPVFMGLVLISILAATVSSGGSITLTMSNLMLTDIYDKYKKHDKKYNPSRQMLHNQVSIVLFIYTAIIIASFLEIKYYEYVLFAWAGLGATFGPAILLSFTWKGTTERGIKYGFIAGALTVIIWQSNSYLSELFYGLLPGFLCSFLTIWMVSHIDKKLIIKNINRTARYYQIK